MHLIRNTCVRNVELQLSANIQNSNLQEGGINQRVTYKNGNVM